MFPVVPGAQVHPSTRLLPKVPVGQGTSKSTNFDRPENVCLFFFLGGRGESTALGINFAKMFAKMLQCCAMLRGSGVRH